MKLPSKFWNDDIRNRVVANLITTLIVTVSTFVITTVFLYFKSLISNETFTTSVSKFFDLSVPIWVFLILFSIGLILILILKRNNKTRLQKNISEKKEADNNLEKLSKELKNIKIEIEKNMNTSAEVKRIALNELKNVEEKLKVSRNNLEKLKKEKERVIETAKLIRESLNDELIVNQEKYNANITKLKLELDNAKIEIENLNKELIEVKENQFEYDEATLKLDRDLFNKIRNEILVDGSIIEVLKEQSFATPFKLNTLEDLWKIEREYTKPDFEFLNPELESIKSKLSIKIVEFTTLLASNTFPTIQGYQALSERWSSESLTKIRNQIHETQSEICNYYDDLIRLGRRVLKI